VTIRVIVADDEPLVRAGIVLLLRSEPDLEVVAEASDGAQACELALAQDVDVVVMDIRMPVLDGIAATAMLASRPESGGHVVKVLVLTTFDDDDDVYGALLAGASGYLLKRAAPTDLATAVRRVAGGEAWLDPAVAGRVIASLARIPHVGENPTEDVARLTPREREVLVLMAHGLSNQEIAGRLFVGEGTVKTHVSRILLKTASRDRPQAIALAYRSGLVRA
jgi:DNA-binding NarL/FixJ family response regulator